MAFAPHLAEQRFGYGLSPFVPAPVSIDQMLADLRRDDAMQARFPIEDYWYIQQQLTRYNRFIRHARENEGTDVGAASRAKARSLVGDVRSEHARWFAQTQLRRIHTATGFRERLVAFWADHFTAIGRQVVLKSATPLYVEQAVRPHVSGRFADLLLGCVRHPLMLHYLDQEVSIGPTSAASRRRANGRGLNENLARELLELHTLGVGGPYDQQDVRELAMLLTGLTRGRDHAFRYRPAFAEPGRRQVLGKHYGDTPSMARIEAVLRDLAAHPATAANIARKLAVHFISDDPSPALIAAMKEAYLSSDGDLVQVYEAMLRHRDAWLLPATNIRPPDEFVSSALRALGVPEQDLHRLDLKQIRQIFFRPFDVMGQKWQSPNGPDGWAEEDGAWVTPQGIAGRMEWAMQMPRKIQKDLPDPRQFVGTALGEVVPKAVAFAASAAESRAEAIGLVLMSPAFQRR